MRKLLRTVYRSVFPQPPHPCDADTLAVLTATLKPDSNTVDAGCNRGMVLQEVLRLAPNGRHVAFEPVPGLHRLLVRRFPKAKCHQIALSDQQGEVTFNHFRDMDGFSGLKQRELGSEYGRVEQITVPTARLDEVLPAGHPVTLIKIDVEGAEYNLLRGAEQTIRRCQPVVVFECNKGGLEHFGFTPEQLFDLLQDYGLTRIVKLTGWTPTAPELTRDQFAKEFWDGTEYMYVATKPT